MQLNVSHDFLAKQNSTRAAIVMDHFGIDFETGRHVIADDLELPINSGDVVLFTGASGSGKSSLMRAVGQQLQQEDVLANHTAVDNADTAGNNNAARPQLINIDDLELGDRILIDRLPLPVEESMQLLSACGLGEAHLMLRTPAELSDGQRYRFRLALGFAQQPRWIVADEFTATLDRTLARVIAFNIRRLADRTHTGFLLATTHSDIVEDVAADLHVQCRLDGEISLDHRGDSSDPTADGESSFGAMRAMDDSAIGKSNDAGRLRSPASLKKKERSASLTISGSAPRPNPTGGISLGGIIGAIRWGSRGL